MECLGFNAHATKAMLPEASRPSHTKPERYICILNHDATVNVPGHTGSV